MTEFKENRHGKDRPGIATVGAKVKISVRNDFDKVCEKKGFKNRSEAVKQAFQEYLDKHLRKPMNRGC